VTRPTDRSWEDRAACASPAINPELFYADKVELQLKALEVCGRCPVRQRCAAEALARREAFGIWGGTTPEDRLELLGRPLKVGRVA